MSSEYSDPRIDSPTVVTGAKSFTYVFQRHHITHEDQYTSLDDAALRAMWDIDDIAAAPVAIKQGERVICDQDMLEQLYIQYGTDDLDTVVERVRDAYATGQIPALLPGREV